ncbi:tRNA (adenosine(37)-N6)-threonylcarbamoyltransferase complex ATPase subunit type 1 TsaE [Pseudoprimorskyibacter insulae]|uniref:tRNA threonylcarbamoyladenosine biosynthesis protein TsaE n=1 Tax=Pseudoprimorskyibacter insulae TaxID=1695997 RepID=A0A2R8AU06_9RHOB|nr:tRNA (adenosine(37)-N6)-threonylcarbamoyltransferase complex ATPase subunit type 1 TsaE [Pseudoprimorskyibacter insulae]SPF79531.1 tRNA threonylcarbamoyladenosine biosynthesis protein TsaE [Pseudoprimorskyibacter insulae]
MHHAVISHSPEQTADLARTIARDLAAGDVILLHGEIGAGKTHFARSLIQSLLEVPEDVPSPTFTLIQTYDTLKGEVWHADLYRLSSPDEAVELGLDEAFETAICLIEWPDRLEDLTPASALTMRFAARDDDSRSIELDWSDPRWTGRLNKVLS